MEKEPKIEQPSIDSQREYTSIRDNDPTIVSILGTNKKYKIRWLKNGQIDKLSRLLIRKADTDDQEGQKDSPMDAIIEDSKIGCKAAAITILDGYWKIKFRYWFLWRWFYYIRQYDNDQLMPLLEVMKKKIPLTQFLMTTMCLTVAKGTLMNMRTEEAEATLQELATVRQEGMEKPGNT